MEFKPGVKLGKLTLIKFYGRDKRSKKQWLCQCDCGNECIRLEENLKTTKVPHCGCAPGWKGFNKRFVDLTGQKFGRLTVKGFHGKDKYSHNLWLCVCDCGNVTITETGALKQGKASSCGCYQVESTIQRHTTHGKTHSRLYRIYAHMKDRCCVPTDKAYKHYGGRGISICEEWANNFQAFYDWAMANGYKSTLSIDRIDVNGNYCPENCRWATDKVQINNRRTTITHAFNTETHTLTEWAEITGLKYSRLYAAYRREDDTLNCLLKKHITK